jgi:hypothetical protein
MGPGLALGPLPDPARGPGLGLVAQIMFRSGTASNDSNQALYRTFQAFSGHSFFAKKNLFVVTLVVCSWHCPTYLIFSGIFVAAPSHK